MPRGGAKHFMFTYYPKDGDIKNDHPIINKDIMRYMVWGPEIGEKEEHLHCQGHIELLEGITGLKQGNQVCKLMKKHGCTKHLCGFAERSDRPIDSINYCKGLVSKKGYLLNPMLYEEGVTSAKGERNDMKDIQKMIKDGASDEEIAEKHFGTWCRYKKSFQDYRLLVFGAKPRKKLWSRVIYGRSNSGKGTLARAEYPGFCVINANAGWYCNYKGEEGIILEEFDPNTMNLTEFKCLLSDGPHLGKTKGSWVPIKANKFVILSNYHPSKWYPYCDEEGKKAIMKRCKIIHKHNSNLPEINDWVKEEEIYTEFDLLKGEGIVETKML